MDLPNHTTRSVLKSATGITLEFAKKVDLDSLKSEVDESDIDKLQTVPVDLSKITNVVKK